MKKKNISPNSLIKTSAVNPVGETRSRKKSAVQRENDKDIDSINPIKKLKLLSQRKYRNRENVGTTYRVECEEPMPRVRGTDAVSARV